MVARPRPHESSLAKLAVTASFAALLALSCTGAVGQGGRSTGSGGATSTARDAGTGGGATPGSGGRPFGVPDAAGATGGAAVSTDAAGDGLAVDAAAPSDGPGPGADAALPGWTLVWSDEFDIDGAPSAASWRFENGFVRNEELQWYQPANATIAGGLLTIEGRRERVANPNYMAGSTDWKRNRQFAEYTSTSMTTSGRHTFTYGRFEARARIDVRTGSWPAFWTVGASGGWPGGGEVDIMEFYAGRVLANVCRPAGSNCNWSSITRQVSTLGADWASQFHVWVMEWDAQNIDLFLDGTLMNHFSVPDALSAGATTNPYVGRPLYIILNLALGANGGDPTNTTFPMKYEVDYVRVYQRAP